MPTYTYKCQTADCGKKFDRFLKMVDYQTPQQCACGGATIRVIDKAPMGYVRPNYEAYHCPVTGNLVDGRKRHEENLKQTGCRLLEPGEKEVMLTERQREDQAFERQIDADIDREIYNLPSDKREHLFNEVLGGADSGIARSTPQL